MSEQRQSAVRRKNREVSDDSWIENMLTTSPFGVFGFSDGEQPYVNGNLFIYDPSRNAVYFHTAGEGRTKQMVIKNPRVVFSIFQMGRLLPALDAVDFSCEYASVVVFGRVVIETDPRVKTDILARWFVKYAPHLKMGQDFRPFDDKDVARTTVYRLDIDEWSGKQHREPEDFPGAFEYKV